VTSQALTSTDLRQIPIETASPVEGRNAQAADGSTFAPGLRLLPAHTRQDVQRLYRVLRTLDDLVDEDDPRADQRLHAVECWTRGEHFDSPETRALCELDRRHALPREALFEFCQGMRHDIDRASIDTEEDFARYCQRAGGAVGVVLVSLLGVVSDEREEARSGDVRREAEAHMATLGRAMQITNILRDIDEDMLHGRLYIPRTLIERFGFPAPGAREALLREQIVHADALYEDGLRAIPLLRNGRAAMAVSAALYREILRQIERDGFGSRPGRAVVPAWRARLLIAKHRTANLLGG
jgi:phytoene synthase